MIKGHTFFSPDSNFSHIKQKYLCAEAFSIEHLAEIVRNSSKTNNAQVLDSSYFFEYEKVLGKLFKDIPNITSYHHCHEDASCPGIIKLKENTNSMWTNQNILKVKTLELRTYAKNFSKTSSSWLVRHQTT